MTPESYQTLLLVLLCFARGATKCVAPQDKRNYHGSYDDHKHGHNTNMDHPPRENEDDSHKDAFKKFAEVVTPARVRGFVNGVLDEPIEGKESRYEHPKSCERQNPNPVCHSAHVGLVLPVLGAVNVGGTG
jgi:hypothetical protein